MFEPISADNEQAEIAAFGKTLRIVRSRAKLIARDGHEMPIPEAIYKVLKHVIPLLAADNAVSIVPVGHLATTQEAANLLNVSRPYLIKLLDNGTIPYVRSKEPGSHRRIRFEDLMEYKHKRDIERHKQLRRLTKLSQEAGLYA